MKISLPKISNSMKKSGLNVCRGVVNSIAADYAEDILHDGKIMILFSHYTSALSLRCWGNVKLLKKKVYSLYAEEGKKASLPRSNETQWTSQTAWKMGRKRKVGFSLLTPPSSSSSSQHEEFSQFSKPPQCHSSSSSSSSSSSLYLPPTESLSRSKCHSRLFSFCCETSEWKSILRFSSSPHANRLLLEPRILVCIRQRK